MTFLGLLSKYSSDLLASVVVAAVSFVLGNFRVTIVNRIKTRKTRKYWGPLRSRGIALVLGGYSAGGGSVGAAHRQIDASAVLDFEPSGMVGFGDVVALLAIQAHLKALNWDDVPVVHSHNLGDHAKRNLVLVGGPDANEVTDLAMAQGNIPVVFDDAPDGRTLMRVSFPESASEPAAVEVYAPSFAPSDPARVVRDYGFVAQVANPYSGDALAILLVGVYGTATEAAALFVTTSYGVTQLRNWVGRPCLAVFRTEVGRSGGVATPQLERAVPLSR